MLCRALLKDLQRSLFQLWPGHVPVQHLGLQEHHWAGTHRDIELEARRSFLHCSPPNQPTMAWLGWSPVSGGCQEGSQVSLICREGVQSYNGCWFVWADPEPAVEDVEEVHEDWGWWLWREASCSALKSEWVRAFFGIGRLTEKQYCDRSPVPKFNYISITYYTGKKKHESGLKAVCFLKWFLLLLSLSHFFTFLVHTMMNKMFAVLVTSVSYVG